MQKYPYNTAQVPKDEILTVTQERLPYASTITVQGRLVSNYELPYLPLSKTQTAAKPMTGEDATDLRNVKKVINRFYTLNPTYFNNVKNFIPQLNKNAANCKSCSPPYSPHKPFPHKITYKTCTFTYIYRFKLHNVNNAQKNLFFSSSKIEAHAHGPIFSTLLSSTQQPHTTLPYSSPPLIANTLQATSASTTSSTTKPALSPGRNPCSLHSLLQGILYLKI